MRLDIPITEARAKTLTAIRAAGLDADDIDALITDALHFAKGNAAQRQVLSLASKLEQQWYESLDRCQPDYGVYNTAWYVAESFACWYVYSRGYLKDCHKAGIFDSLTVQSVADLGCGIGLTTAALAHRFPGAVVTGTNFPESLQWRVAAILAGGESHFLLAQDVSEHVDVIFASEFFEHVQDPTAYLARVIVKATPQLIIFANTFNAPAIGHFRTYRRFAEERNGTQTARDFTAVLTTHGYQREKYGFWNNRPQVWRKA